MDGRKHRVLMDELVTFGGILLLVTGLVQAAFAAPVINLPPGEVTVTTGNTVWTCHSYFDVTLSNVPPGYDVKNGLYWAWCCDEDTYIDLNTPYQARLYSSYDPNNPFPDEDWDKVNYILNHKKGTCQDVQAAIWYFINHGGYPSSDPAKNMVKDANANGEGFVPVPCNVVAVVVDIIEQPGQNERQHIFIEVHVPSQGVPEFEGSIHVLTSMAGALILILRRTLVKGRK